MTKLHKLLRNAREQFNSIQTEYESIMLSYSHNADLLVERAYVDGVEAAATTVGSCKYCKYYDTRLGVTPNDGHCTVLRDSKQALCTNIKVHNDWYCADFERGKNIKE